jgi:asparagine synthetase B (glutamine-hydrolysing)
MCGYVGFAGEVEGVRLEEGSRAVAHRGPDD